MKLKYYASVLPMLALTLATPVFAQDNADYDNNELSYVNLQETEDTDTKEDDRYLRFEGSVEDVDRENEKIKVLKLDGPEVTVSTKNSVVIKNKRIAENTDISLGDEVIITSHGKSSDGYVMAKGVLVQTEGTFTNFHLDTFKYQDESLVSSDFSIRIPNLDELFVINEQGEELDMTLEELDNAKLVVVYSAATFSIPAVVIQPTIIMLETAKDWSHVQPVEMPTVDPIYPNNIPAVSPVIINMVDMLPFWARGGHVPAPFAEVTVNYQKLDEETSELVEEIIDDVIDENYFIGIEVLIGEEDIKIELGE